MLNIATNSTLLSGPGVKSWLLATPFFWQYVTVAATASLSHQKLELHLPSVHPSEG